MPFLGTSGGLALLSTILFINVRCTSSAIKTLNYMKSAKGYLDRSNVTAYVTRSIECATLCKRRRVCSMFSVTQIQISRRDFGKNLFCRVAYGYSSWTSDVASELFIEYDKAVQSDGYQLQRDGKYYKYYSDNLVFYQAQMACFIDKANVAAGYPALENQIFLNLTPSNQVLPAGAFRMSDFSTGTWVTFDGNYFNTHIPDGVQLWATNQPSGDNAYCLTIGFLGSGQWDDFQCWGTWTTFPRLCRRTIGYNRASNGKYYKVIHVTAASHAEAKQLCQADGAQLAAAPYGPEDNKAMEPFKAQLAALGGWPNTFLVDGTDVGTEGLFIQPNGCQ